MTKDVIEDCYGRSVIHTHDHTEDIQAWAVTLSASPFKQMPEFFTMTREKLKFEDYSQSEQLQILQLAVENAEAQIDSKGKFYYELNSSKNYHGHGFIRCKFSQLEVFCKKLTSLLGYPPSKNGQCCVEAFLLKSTYDFNRWVSYCRKDQSYYEPDLPPKFNPWKKKNII